MERDGESKNILYRSKRLKKFMQTRMKTKKPPENPTPYPFIYHFSRKRYPFHIPSISDKWCPFHIPCLELVSLLTAVNQYTVFFYIEINLKNSMNTQTLFYFSFRSYPLALAGSKSPAVYILSPALDGL